MRVPFLDLSVTHEEIQQELLASCERVIGSHSYILGEELLSFEAEWSTYCNVDFAVGVGNGLDALHLILKALEIGPGDQVIVPVNTFIATWLAVSHSGATPVAVDTDSRTFNLDPVSVESAINLNTKAVIAVHLYGQPANLEMLREICERHEIYLIEDAAQAHGARFEGQRIGSHGVAAAWSFYPGKNLGALGDGGSVTTNNQDLANKVRMLRNYGSAAKYSHLLQGFNSRLDEIQAAMLRVKLARLDDWNSRRATVAEQYLKALGRMVIERRGGSKPRLLSIPYVPPWSEPVWHLFVVRVSMREKVIDSFLEHGVETSIHYPIRPGNAGAYSDGSTWIAGWSGIADDSGELLSLPIGPHLSDEQVQHVVAVAKQIFFPPDRKAL